MNNYKTFSYYAKELLRIIAFGLFMAWLCSGCSNRKQRIIDLIHNYNDSIGIWNAEVYSIENGASKIEQSYMDQFPITYFDNTPQAAAARKEWAKNEKAAFKMMQKAKKQYEDTTRNKKIIIRTRIIHYMGLVDSLKIELYK